jgi:hypothetical protein
MALATTAPSNLMDGNHKLRAAKNILVPRRHNVLVASMQRTHRTPLSCARGGPVSSTERHTSLHTRTDEQAINATWFRPLWHGAADSLAMQAERTGDRRVENAAKVRILVSGQDHCPRNGPSGRTLRLV